MGELKGVNQLLHLNCLLRQYLSRQGIQDFPNKFSAILLTP